MTRTAVLLGAGASVDAGIPQTTEMTKRIVEVVASQPHAYYERSVPTALNYVVATLNARETLRGRGSFDTVDVERVFSAIELLGNREDLDLSAFVGSWTSDILQIDRATDLPSLAGTLRTELLNLNHPNERQIADTLKRFIEKTVGATSGPIFRETLAAMTRALETILAIDSPESVSYLRPVADFAASQPGGLMVATLNYDLAVETMCQSVGSPYTTGIEAWAANGTWSFPETGINLLKLHGSINWRLSFPTTSGPGFMPGRRITEGEDFERGDRPAIVFGQTKLRPDGPFIELLLEFSRGLDQVDHLIVVGYSFRDEHVNEQIKQWVNANQERNLTVIDPDFPLTAPWGYIETPDFQTEMLRSLIPPGPVIIAGQPPPAEPFKPAFEPRLTVVQETAAAALPAVLAGVQ